MNEIIHKGYTLKVIQKRQICDIIIDFTKQKLYFRLLL